VYWVDPSHEELPYTLRVDGKELVVMSYTLEVSDFSTTGDSARTFRQVVDTWKDAFDWLYEEGAAHPARLALVVHPYVTGRPYRMQGLREFIRYVKGFPGVWWCRLGDVADWWLSNYRESHVEEWPNYRTVPSGFLR
jgi:peptidoglycan/xylan/chitin deacetylase (PgdA/CDA1 family)